MIQYIKGLDVKKSLANCPQITFEITDACNLRCCYCAYGEMYDNYDKRNNTYMKSSKAIFFLEYLSNLWRSSYSLSRNSDIYISFYGGEPLLNFDLIEDVVEYFKSNDTGRKPVFSMTTNGLLLNKHIDYLVNHNFKILVSLDGDKYNNSYRVDHSGSCVFDKITSNLDSVKNSFPVFFQNNIQFTSVLHNRNSVEDIVCFFQKKYDKVPSIGELSSDGIRKNKLNIFHEMFNSSVQSVKKAKNKKEIETILGLKSIKYHNAVLFLKRFSPNCYENYLELLVDKNDTAKSMPSGTCLPFSKKVFVTVNGKILPCEKIGHQFFMGRAFDNIEINFLKIAEDFNMRLSLIDKYCVYCHNKGKACSQCMYFFAGLENRDPKVSCIMNRDMFERFVSDQKTFLQTQPDKYRKIINDIILK